ncbi:MAG: long-chain-fatty-acid--CoA ligase [Actinomycetota bacterium]|nr:long-chain-fatty-acid--CoA ligase [Actinomycetota bacterium]
MYVTQALHRLLQQQPQALMTVSGDRRRTVTESVDRIARLASALRSLGVQPGETVGYLGLNSDRYHEFLLAVPWADAVVNPINIRWSAAEIAYSLNDSDCRTVFVDDAFAGIVPQLRSAGADVGTAVYCGDGGCPPGLLDYEELIATTEPVEDARRGGDAVYGVFYTGGTTGHPKGVMLSHRNVVVGSLGALSSGHFISARGRLLHVAPMFHLAGIASWLAGNMMGSTHVMVPHFTPDGTARAIVTHQISDILLVPTMIQMMLDHPDNAGARFESIRHVVYGASPISDTVLERGRKAFPGAAFTQAYGMTELAPVATLLSPADHDDPALTRSAGRAAPHVEIRVVDEHDHDVPCGQVGEITARGENVMIGYRGRPQETSVALRQGWMHTGDMGYLDADGYLFVVDRLKDMIVTGGENVYSAEVENALAEHESVAAVAVIGVPDDRWGERVHAVVVLRPGAAVSAEQLGAHCREAIAGYKVPRSFEFVAELPMSGVGKVLKRDLRAAHWTSRDRQIS